MNSEQVKILSPSYPESSILAAAEISACVDGERNFLQKYRYILLMKNLVYFMLIANSEDCTHSNLANLAHKIISDFAKTNGEEPELVDGGEIYVIHNGESLTVRIISINGTLIEKGLSLNTQLKHREEAKKIAQQYLPNVK